MQDRLLDIVAELDARPPPMPPEELAEAGRSCRGSPTNHFTFLGYRCHDLVVVDGQDALRIVPGSSLGILREDHEQERRDELRGAAAGGSRVRARAGSADRHQGERALDRPPSRLSRLRRHQALRRRRQGVRRAPLPRPLHVDGVQRQPGGHPAAAPQDGQRRRAGGRARAAATPARRWSTSSRAIRATSCSRPARTTCCARRWASSISASGSASGCSCAATRSSAFSSA